MTGFSSALGPYSVPLLGQKGMDGPFVGELREVLGGGMSSLVWACDHAHGRREEAESCAIKHRAALAASAGPGVGSQQEAPEREAIPGEGGGGRSPVAAVPAGDQP